MDRLHFLGPTGRRGCKILLFAATIAVAVIVGRYTGRAAAEGPPATTPLYFSGMLTQGGIPVDGTRNVTLRLRDATDAVRCETTVEGVRVTAGRLRVPLQDPQCAQAVADDPDLWIQAEVDGVELLPRIKVGAVPYALEAGRASEAAGALAAELADLRARVASLETGPGRTCPSGMVAVGSFCIDKYEASAWENADCTGTQYGAWADDYPSSFPDNGNFTIPLYACSLPGVRPSANLTWFQAQQACAASGKHLCTNEEWQTAVAGTYDPGAWPGSAAACDSVSAASGRCLTCALDLRNTGRAGAVAGGTNDCISMHGADDMIGNLWEWVAWWGEAGRTWQTSDGQSAGPWPAAYNGDYTWNLNGCISRSSHWERRSCAGIATC